MKFNLLAVNSFVVSNRCNNFNGERRHVIKNILQQKRSVMKLYTLLPVLLSIFACLATAQDLPKPLKPVTKEQWAEDIDYFAKRLVKKHANAFHFTTEEKFNKAIADLKKRPSVFTRSPGSGAADANYIQHRRRAYKRSHARGHLPLSYVPFLVWQRSLCD